MLVCHTTLISHKYLYIPSLPLLSCPPPPGHHRAPVWASCVTQHLPMSYQFYTRSNPTELTSNEADTYTPPCVEQIANGRLPYNTGSSHWSSVMTLRGGEERTLSLLHVVMVMCQGYSLDPTVSFPHCVHKSILYVCVSILALQISSHQYHFSR